MSEGVVVGGACSHCGGDLGSDSVDMWTVSGENSRVWSEVHVLWSLCRGCMEVWRKDNCTPRAVALERYVTALSKAARVPRSEAREVRVRLSVAVVVDRDARGTAQAVGERSALPSG
jgi:hypothetical protein